jgi:ABC-type multidrug transport system ATPase subunit
VRKNLNILQNISLVFEPREFIVVVGQSGGGKSTLVDAIAGYRPATHGKVVVNGVDVYKNFDAIRNEIGFVPQRDIIHMELTVYQALDYAARLRMPRDTSKDERHQRIMETLQELDLLNRKDVQISRLSGGQQKRVSIGVELLTRPGLFFLDEPTSGLDPGTETLFMHLMRRMADQGRTIVMVTHATKNVMLADKVVFLARGGYLAWFGPPNEALEYFDQYRTERERLTQDMEFDQIYAILDNPEKGSAQDWAKRFQEHPAYQSYITTPLQQRGAALPLAPAGEAARKPAKRRSTRVSSLRQFVVLSGRNIKILTRDRSSLILMLLAAPLVAMLDFVIAPLMGRAPFNYIDGDAANASITLFLLTIYALLVGGLSQMREIVKESDIYKRERLVNLRIFPYVTSKIWVAALLAFYHAAAYTIIHYLAFKMPGGVAEFVLIYFTLVLAVMAGMVGGILASALAPNASSAPMIMILLIVPLIVLSGALAPVPSNISAIASTRWAFEGLIGITGMGSDVEADPCWQFPEQVREEMTLEQAAAANCRCMGVAVFDPKSCNFPGIGQYYVPEVSQPAPTEPPPLPDAPTEPEIPPRPEAPADNTDQIQVAQFLNELEDYMDEVEQIQTGYKNDMTLYQAQADIYQEEMLGYQKELAKYELARNSAVQAAQGMIESMKEQYGWAWVNKHDPAVYRTWLTRAWVAQLIIMFVYFIFILLLIKRKDVK